MGIARNGGERKPCVGLGVEEVRRQKRGIFGEKAEEMTREAEFEGGEDRWRGREEGAP